MKGKCLLYIAFCFVPFSFAQQDGLPAEKDEIPQQEQQVEKPEDKEKNDSTAFSPEGLKEAVSDNAKGDHTDKAAAQNPSDEGAIPGTKESEKRKLKLIKRKYNYRQQIILSVSTMVFVALMMTTAQSWNPK